MKVMQWKWIVLSALPVFLIGCPGKGGGGGGSSQASDPTMTQFIQEYSASRPGANSQDANRYDTFVLRTDATIQYYYEVNNYCRIRLYGNLEKVSLQNNYYNSEYAVTYRYTTFTNNSPPCSGYSCRQYNNECADYLAGAGRRKTKFVRSGRNPDRLVLEP